MLIFSFLLLKIACNIWMLEKRPNALVAAFFATLLQLRTPPARGHIHQCGPAFLVCINSVYLHSPPFASCRPSPESRVYRVFPGCIDQTTICER